MLDWLPIDRSLLSNFTISLIHGSLEGSIVFVLVWVILRLFPKIHPTLRCWLWRIVYLKFLTSFIGIGPIQLPWLSLQKILPALIVRPFYLNLITKWNTIVPNISITLNDMSDYIWLPALEKTFDPLSMLFFRFTLLIKYLIVIWVLGFCWYGIRLVYLWHYNRLKAKDSYPVNHPVLKEMYLKFCAQLKIQKAPLLLWSDSIGSPSLQGLIHPKIILPVSILSQYKLEEIKLILAHELAHFKRGDLLWNWLPVVTRGFFFFHPLVWLAERECRILPEICSDHLAIRFTGTKKVDYGKVLLKATVQPGSRKIRLAQVGINEFSISKSKKALAKRLKAIEGFNQIHPQWKIISLLALVLFGLAAVIPWRFFPPVFYSIEYNRPNFTVSGNIPDPEKIYLRDFEISIDDQRIIEGIVTDHSFGWISANSFKGYLLTRNPSISKNKYRIKVSINTTAGDFRENYVVDFSDKGLWTNYSL